MLVTLPSFEDSFDAGALVAALEETYQGSQVPIRGLMLTNPHNPLGVCYPRQVLEECLRWCTKHGLHFISDEVYALTRFDSLDLANLEPFVSILSLDLDELGVSKEKVHMVWSTSKDFGMSGFRMVCLVLLPHFYFPVLFLFFFSFLRGELSRLTCMRMLNEGQQGCAVTQHNQEMAVGLALAANTQISALSAIFTTALLSSEKLPELISLNSERLTKAYATMTRFLKRNNIAYVPANTGLWVIARVASSWEEEAKVVGRLKDAGVLVSSGKGYHGPEGEAGWIRLGFSVGEEELREAIRRMESVFIHRDAAADAMANGRESDPVKKRREVKKKRRLEGNMRREIRAEGH